MYFVKSNCTGWICVLLYSTLLALCLSYNTIHFDLLYLKCIDQLQCHILPRISVVLHSLAMFIWPARILVNAIESPINKHASLTSSVMKTSRSVLAWVKCPPQLLCLWYQLGSTPVGVEEWRSEGRERGGGDTYAFCKTDFWSICWFLLGLLMLVFTHQMFSQWQKKPLLKAL